MHFGHLRILENDYETSDQKDIRQMLRMYRIGMNLLHGRLQSIHACR